MRKCTFYHVLRSLIRVFVVRMKKLCILGYPKCRSEDFDQTALNFPGPTRPKAPFLLQLCFFFFFFGILGKSVLPGNKIHKPQPSKSMENRTKGKRDEFRTYHNYRDRHVWANSVDPECGV